MHAWQVFKLDAFIDSLVSLSTAFILGSIIGYERQYRQRTAGLRTNALVAIAAAAFVDMAHQINGATGTTQVAAYVVSGVGFLGAGTIMKEGLNVRGLNTAATLWGSAAVGVCSGAGLLAEAILAAIFVLAANTLLRPVVNSINRKPINEHTSELTYQLHVIVSSDEQKDALATLDSLLENAEYPLGDLDIEPFGEDDVEITATLLSTSVNAEKLDSITQQLNANPHVIQAFWNPSTTE